MQVSLVLSKYKSCDDFWKLHCKFLLGNAFSLWKSCNCKNQLWWVCVCRSIFLSLTYKSPPFTVILPRVSSILFKSLCEFVLLEAVIWRPSRFPEKSLWSGSNTRLPTPCPHDALTEFIASSTLRKAKFSIAVNSASCTLVSTVVINYPLHSVFYLQFFLKCVQIYMWTINLSWVVSII